MTGNFDKGYWYWMAFQDNLSSSDNRRYICTHSAKHIIYAKGTSNFTGSPSCTGIFKFCT